MPAAGVGLGNNGGLVQGVEGRPQMLLQVVAIGDVGELGEGESVTGGNHLDLEDLLAELGDLRIAEQECVEAEVKEGGNALADGIGQEREGGGVCPDDVTPAVAEKDSRTSGLEQRADGIEISDSLALGVPVQAHRREGTGGEQTAGQG